MFGQLRLSLKQQVVCWGCRGPKQGQIFWAGGSEKTAQGAEGLGAAKMSNPFETEMNVLP